MALIETEEAARRLARAIASDLSLYNEEKIMEGITKDTLFTALSEELEEGRALFKSREERKNRTELIVLVTPEITKPLEPGDAVPSPPMPREFMAPAVPAEKRSSVNPEKQAIQANAASEKQTDTGKKQKSEKKSGFIKGIFARKG